MLAATDPLTGCLDRRALLDRLGRVAAGTGEAWVVCLVDLDGFEGVNDLDGHAAWDAVLPAVAAALSGVVRETDTAARLGGDEFAVLAEVEPGGSGTPAARLRDAVARVGTSLGVTGASAPPRSGPVTRATRCSAAPTRPCTGPRAPATTG